MNDPTLIADLIRAGVDPDLVQRVATALVEASSKMPADEAAERRRAWDRERKRQKRNSTGHSTGQDEDDEDINSTGIPPEFHRTPRARVDVKQSTTEKPNKKTTTPPQRNSTGHHPRQELEKVLDPEHAEAVLEHRQRIRAPLTAHAAKLLAQKLGKAENPNAAADHMIERGWRGFDLEWMKPRPNGHAPPAQDAPIVAEVGHSRDYIAKYLAEKAEKDGGSSSAV